MNKENIDLIIDGKKTELKKDYKLKQGKNNIILKIKK